MITTKEGFDTWLRNFASSFAGHCTDESIFMAEEAYLSGRKDATLALTGVEEQKVEEVISNLDGKPYISAIRLDDQGFVDDIAISCDMFRLEQMSHDTWWAAAYRGDKATSFHIGLSRSRRRVDVEVQYDQIGCKDDKKK